jgi:hypothetical protein
VWGTNPTSAVRGVRAAALQSGAIRGASRGRSLRDVSDRHAAAWHSKMRTRKLSTRKMRANVLQVSGELGTSLDRRDRTGGRRRAQRPEQGRTW